MSVETALDAAHAQMESDSDSIDARLSFYEVLAGIDLIVLLEVPVRPGSNHISPLVAETADGRIVLAFDTPQRLARFLEQPAHQATVPGHVLLSMLAGSGLSLGINFGVAPSSTLLPPAGIDWAAEQLGDPVVPETSQPIEILVPNMAEARILAIDARLAAMPGMVSSAWLARLTHANGHDIHTLALVGVDPSLQSTIAEAIAATHRLSGDQGEPLDVAFLADTDHDLIAMFMRHGLGFEIPQPKPADAPMRGPGMDSDKPPILK